MKMLINEIKEHNISFLTNDILQKQEKEVLEEVLNLASMNTLRLKRIKELKDILKYKGSVLEDYRLLTKSEIKDKIKKYTEQSKMLEEKIKKSVI